MRVVLAPRASAILYHLLVSRADRRPFLLPANICPIVPLTFLKAGIPFDFVDISPTSLHMDLERASAQLESGRYGGLLYAHTYGETSTPDDFFVQMRSLDESLLFVDDRCLCPPDAAARSGCGAQVSLYSSGYAKVVDIGFGGYAFLSEEIVYHETHLPFDAAALEALEKSYKQAIAKNRPYTYQDSPWLETNRPLPGWEEYWAMVAAALAEVEAHRQAINTVYAERLPAEICLPPAYQGWRYNIRVPDKQRVLAAIFDAGLFASSHYASLAGIFAPGRCLHAEKLAGEVINLFNDHHFNAAMAEQICDIILENL